MKLVARHRAGGKCVFLSLWSLFFSFCGLFCCGENQIIRERNLGGCFEHWHLKLGGRVGVGRL